MRRSRRALERLVSGIRRGRARLLASLAARFPRLTRLVGRHPFVPPLIGIALLVGTAVLAIVLLGLGHSGRAAPARASLPPDLPGEGASDKVTREVLLFFQRKERLWLGTETGEIFSTLTDTEQAKQVLELLVRGPTSEGLAPTLPEGTRLLEIYLSPDGTAYADFSRDLAEKHAGGTHAEVATIYSIIDSLAYNIPRIRRVQILLDGHEVQTLAGHVGLFLPLPPSYDFVDRTPVKKEKESGPAAPRPAPAPAKAPPANAPPKRT